MPTVVELRTMAKEQGVRGYSKMVKAELEAALGLEVTGAPRSAPRASPAGRAGGRAPAAAPAPAPVQVQAPVEYVASSPKVVERAEGDVVVLSVVDPGASSLITTYMIRAEHVDDLDKLAEQVALPMSEREVEGQGGLDYVERLISEHGVRMPGPVYEVSEGERVIFASAVSNVLE